MKPVGPAVGGKVNPGTATEFRFLLSDEKEPHDEECPAESVFAVLELEAGESCYKLSEVS